MSAAAAAGTGRSFPGSAFLISCWATYCHSAVGRPTECACYRGFSHDSRIDLEPCDFTLCFVTAMGLGLWFELYLPRNRGMPSILRGRRSGTSTPSSRRSGKRERILAGADRHGTEVQARPGRRCDQIDVWHDRDPRWPGLAARHPDRAGEQRMRAHGDVIRGKMKLSWRSAAASNSWSFRGDPRCAALTPPSRAWPATR